MTLLALYSGPKFFETLFSITCSFQVRCSSINTPEYLIEIIHFISSSLINNHWNFNGILSFSRALWNSVYIILSLFRDKLLALNHLKNLIISKLAVWKGSFMFLCEKKRFISSANIMGSNTLDTLHKSVTHTMKRIGPKIDHWGTPQIISKLDAFMALVCLNCFLFER